MAAETANYGLKKPGAEDFYNIEDFNWNADVIDAELAKRAELGEDGKVPAAQLPAMDFDPAGSAAAVQTALSGHTGDNVRHLTAAERTAWNAKADGASTSAHISNTNNPPGVTAAQVGAVPLSGGTLTGNLDIAKTIASVVLRTGDSSNRLSGRLMKNANVEGTVDDGLYLTDYGADGSEATLKIQGGQQRLRIKLGGTDYAVYHEGSKPTPADIGAIPFDDSRADIPEGADLNSYTAVGAYRCKNNATAGSLTNSPTTDAFIMDILPSTGTSRALDGNYAYLIQKIMTNGNRYYARKVSTNGNVSTPVYGAWIEFYTTLNKPTPADIGAAVKYRYTATIPTGTWTEVSGGGYYKDITVSGITAAMTPCVGVVQTSDVVASELMVEEFANNIRRIETMAGKIRVYTRTDGAAPSVNIPIQLVGTV